MEPGKPLDFNQLEENNYIGIPGVLPGAFTPQECQTIIALGQEFEQLQANVGSNELQDFDLSYRNSQIHWMAENDKTSWIFNRVISLYKQANSFYKVNTTGISFLQVTQYPTGGKYEWHEDIGTGLISKRKLSLSVQLSNPDDYDGGDLEFLNPSPHQSQFRGQGNAIIFPSFLAHRVTEVTRGTRWSLITWVFGPPYK